VTYEASVALQRRILVPLLLDPEINPYRDLPEMYRDLHVSSMPPDGDVIRAVAPQEPWIKSIRELVQTGTQRRMLMFGAGAILALFVLLSILYTSVTLHNSIVEWQAGLRYLERGPYSKVENERLKSALRNATSIDLLAVNANSFSSTFRQDLEVFFKNPNNRMRVLFADPNTDFYKEMTKMTTRGIEENPKAIAADESKLEYSRQVIRSEAKDPDDQVQFKEYDTQFRIPMIIVDHQYCFLTLRLTPDQAQETIRFELGALTAGTPLQRTVAKTLDSLGLFLSPSTQVNLNVESCQRHFDEVWKNSKRFN